MSQANGLPSILWLASLGFSVVEYPSLTLPLMSHFEHGHFTAHAQTGQAPPDSWIALDESLSNLSLKLTPQFASFI
jgi:hypothetical protein